jgi:hypothetical protein
MDNQGRAMAFLGGANCRALAEPIVGRGLTAHEKAADRPAA